MKEHVFEDLIAKYPELIEDDLKLSGRQVNVKGKFVDLLFEDKYGQKLIIELKVGTILRKHIGQIMDYEGYIVSPYDPTIRVMLVGNRVPMNLQVSLDHHGIEWKEIPLPRLVTFLNDKGDKDLLRLVSEEETENNSTEYGCEKEDMSERGKSSIKTKPTTTGKSATDTTQRRVNSSNMESIIVQSAHLMKSGLTASQIAAKLNIPLEKALRYVRFLKNNKHPSVIEFFSR